MVKNPKWPPKAYGQAYFQHITVIPSTVSSKSLHLLAWDALYVNVEKRCSFYSIKIAVEDYSVPTISAWLPQATTTTIC